jgi:hypothetical protein
MPADPKLLEVLQILKGRLGAAKNDLEAKLAAVHDLEIKVQTLQESVDVVELKVSES